MLRMLSAVSRVQDTAVEEPYRSQEPGWKVFHNIKEAILSYLLLTAGQTAKPDQVALGLVQLNFENSQRQRHGYCAKVNNSDGRKFFLPLAGSFLAASCMA